MDKTFSIIKPDATKRNITGSINQVIEKNGLRIIAQKRIKLTTDQAENFYSVHKDRPFFRDLIEYMTSEPVVVQVLSGEILYLSLLVASSVLPQDLLLVHFYQSIYLLALVCIYEVLH